MNRKTALSIALALAAIHLILALAYASVTPYRQPGRLKINGGVTIPDVGAPDERQHANYIQWLLDGKGFPVFAPGTPESGEYYENHQPPAYYLLAAGFSKLVGAEPTNAETGGRIRWLNGLIGAGTVLGVFYLALWGVQKENVAVIAAAIAGLLPMHCGLSGAISNDPLLFLLATWIVAMCVYAVRNGWTSKLALTVGVLAGLALLTKTTALALLPVLLVAAVIPQTKRPTLKLAALTGAVLLLLSAPWMLRNKSLYGDPFAMAAFNSAFQGSAQKATIIGQIEAQNQVEGGGTPEIQYWRDWVGWWTARSFVGTFGYMDIWMNGKDTPYGGSEPNTLYRVLLGILAVLGVVGVVAVFSPDSKDQRPAHMVGTTLVLAILASFLLFNTHYFQAQGRYLYPAIGPIAVALALGLDRLAGKRWPLALAILGALLMVSNIYMLTRLPGDFEHRRISATSMQLEQRVGISGCWFTLEDGSYLA